MPWTASDATKFTSKADTPKLQGIWAEAANAKLEGGASDGEAVRAGNAAVKAAKSNMAKKRR